MANANYDSDSVFIDLALEESYQTILAKSRDEWFKRIDTRVGVQSSRNVKRQRKNEPSMDISYSSLVLPVLTLVLAPESVRDVKWLKDMPP